MARGVLTAFLMGASVGRASIVPFAAAVMGVGGSSISGGTDWRYFAAGGISAALSHGYTTPIDVVKTRMQTDPAAYNGSIPLALKKIVETEGPLFLLQGFVPTCVGYGIEGALKFGCYELCKPLFGGLTPTTFGDYLLASVVAGAVASVVLCPAEDVRIRQVADPTYASSAFGALRRLAREKGPLASFGGLPAMLSKQIPYTMGKQVSFDVLCASFYTAFALAFADGNAAALNPNIKALVPFAGAAVTSMIACVLSHPGDMLLTEYFKGAKAVVAPPGRAKGRSRVVAAPAPPAGIGGALKSIVDRSGPLGLFAGLKARFVHVAAIIIVQLVVYDSIKQMLGLPSTGSH
jgi:solute carrier family 25 phosphate transporter 3